MISSRRRALLPLLGLACLAGPAGFVQAQCPTTRIVSPDGADAFRFGGAMANNASEGGDQWVVGEHNQVWAYDLVGGRLVQRQDLRIPRPMPHHLFGTSVAMEGDRLVIGCYYVDWPGRDRAAGGAFVYQHVDGLWVQTADLEPPAELGSEGTGSAVAIDGDTILAGGGSWREVIVYGPSPTAPGQWTALQVIEGDRDDQFGWPIAAADGWLFVGANRDDTLTFAGGSVYVYRRGPDGRYAQTQKIDGPALSSYRIQVFGAALDCDGRTLAVGSGAASPRIEGQGAVYTFELADGIWTPTQVLTHRNAMQDDYFGYLSLRVDGNRLLVRADGDRTRRSDAAVYTFQRTASGLWRQSSRPLPTTPLHARQYGASMTLGGDWVILGASQECEPDSTRETGAAYLFDLSCYECPDLDADDVLSVFDYLEFMRAFEAGEAIADFDNDGTLTVADFLAFQNAFAVGCP